MLRRGQLLFPKIPARKSNYILPESTKAEQWFRVRCCIDKINLLVLLDFEFNSLFCAPAWTLMGHEYVELRNTAAAVQCYRKVRSLFYLFYTGRWQPFMNPRLNPTLGSLCSTFCRQLKSVLPTTELGMDWAKRMKCCTFTR